MSEFKSFPTGAVLTVVTGILVSRNHIQGVYEVLNWMTGESLFTHQLPRVSREAEPVLLKAHPELSAAVEEASQVTPENCLQWLTRWEERYGLTIDVPRLTIEEHERIDALSELAEHIHPDRIIEI